MAVPLPPFAVPGVQPAGALSPRSRCGAGPAPGAAWQSFWQATKAKKKGVQGGLPQPLAGPIGGLAGPGTALPMAIGMLGCFTLSLVATLFARFREGRAPRGFPAGENPPAVPDGGAAL